MSDELDPVLLAKWLSHELSQEDERALTNWLAADQAHSGQLDQLRELWRRAGEITEARAATADPGEPSRWDRVLQATRPNRPATRSLHFPFVRQRSPWRSAAVAAAAAVVVGAVGLSIGADPRDRGTTRVPAPMQTYETSRGERAEFRLGDGTLVMLHVASRLRVPVDFGDRGRLVYLEGAAYFNVVHDSRLPFLVHAGGIVAEDLGTAFSVQAYRQDRHARVVVRTGRVSLHPVAAPATTNRVTLGPGQVGTIDAAGRPLVQPADTAAEFAWVGGTLVLDGTPLRDALPQLDRWFDLEFRLADSSLGRVSVAATLTNQPTDEALSFLAASLGLRQVRRARVVTFYPAKPGR